MAPHAARADAMTINDAHPWPATSPRMRKWLGDEAPDFFTALAKRDYGLRLNPARGPQARLKAALPWRTEPIPWCAEGVWLTEAALEGAPALGAHPYHTAGVFYVQDPSAMAAALLLNPQPGEGS